MLLNGTGQVKIIIEGLNGIVIPDPDNSITNRELTVEKGEIFAATIACGSLPGDLLPKSMHPRLSEIIFKRSLMDFVLKGKTGLLCGTKNTLNQ